MEARERFAIEDDGAGKQSALDVVGLRRGLAGSEFTGWSDWATRFGAVGA